MQGETKKITLKIPIKHECCLIYNSMHRDYKEEIPCVKNEMLWGCSSDSIIESNPAEKEKQLRKRDMLSGALRSSESEGASAKDRDQGWQSSAWTAVLGSPRETRSNQLQPSIPVHTTSVHEETLSLLELSCLQNIAGLVGLGWSQLVECLPSLQTHEGMCLSPRTTYNQVWWHTCPYIKSSNSSWAT